MLWIVIIFAARNDDNTEWTWSLDFWLINSISEFWFFLFLSTLLLHLKLTGTIFFVTFNGLWFPWIITLVHAISNINGRYMCTTWHMIWCVFSPCKRLTLSQWNRMTTDCIHALSCYDSSVCLHYFRIRLDPYLSYLDPKQHSQYIRT